MVRTFVDGSAGLVAPMIILGGILGGIFTPTEAAVAAALYALAIGALVYREISWRDFVAMLWDTVDQTARVMFIIAAAGLFGWLLIYLRAPAAIVTSLTSISDSPWVILLLINAILLVLGCFMEGVAIMLLTVPILLPVLAKFGISPLHFGVVMTLNLMVGLLTPPFGMVLYAISTIADVPIVKLTRELVPFIVAIVVVLGLITYVPWLVTWLPHLVMGSGR